MKTHPATLEAAQTCERNIHFSAQLLQRSLRLPQANDDLAPAQPIGRAAAIRLSHASAHDESTDFRDRPERHDPVACLTVYAMNAAIMLFYFPVGFALLIFNILGGENLRTTSHTLALTGLGMSLATTASAAMQTLL